MIRRLEYQISQDLLQNLKKEIPRFPEVGDKIIMNTPTGNFFYDGWEISKEFRNTIWERVLESLPFTIGQVRLNRLNSRTAYYRHADIDNRYHLNITGEDSFLVDLDKNILHSVNNDGYWYEMNAGIQHSAVNFGNEDRIQLVVRKLLQKNNLINPIEVKIKLKNKSEYTSDDLYISKINFLIKEGVVNNFFVDNDYMSFNIEADSLDKLDKISSKDHQ